jgi:hypothetical protein
MRDGVVRRTVKRLARFHFEANLLLHRRWRRWRGERPFVLGGDCRRCAACCEAPAIAVSRIVWFMPFVRRLFLSWQRFVNGFELEGSDRANRTFVFRCTHFDPRTRSCDSYDSRPGICRDYPRALLDQPSPELLPGCGYRPVSLRAGAWSAALARQPLSREQREKLRKGLFLEG